jgi:hypothetical protein
MRDRSFFVYGGGSGVSRNNRLSPDYARSPMTPTQLIYKLGIYRVQRRCFPID